MGAYTPGGRMGTSAPTQGHDRFRRGRCPQRPVDNGCTPVVPLIRHGLRSCYLLPCGAKALAVPSEALKCRWRSPHPSRLTPCHLPPGEGIVRANLDFPLPGGGYIHSEIFKYDSTFRTEKCPVIPLPVPSYTVGYRGSRRIRRADAWRAKDVDWDGLCAGGWPWD